MGLYPAGPLDGTWLHALFYTALDMQLPAALPALDVLIPYCFMCGDATASSFTTLQYGPVIPPSQSGKVAVVRTPSGEAQALLFQALEHATQMSPLEFSPNPVLTPDELRSRQVLGWELKGSTVQWVVLNQGQAIELEFEGDSVVSCLHPATQEDVTRHGLLVSELVYSTPRFDDHKVLLPAFALCTST